MPCPLSMSFISFIVFVVSVESYYTHVKPDLYTIILANKNIYKFYVNRGYNLIKKGYFF